MDTIQMYGYQVLEILYESNTTFLCRAQEQEGKNYLIKALKSDQPTIDQLMRLEFEYTLLNHFDVIKAFHVHKLIKNYKGHMLVLEDEGGIPLLNMPVFKNIYTQGASPKRTELKEMLKIFIEMTGAIHRIHDQHFIHMDINSNNFLYFPDTEGVSILDFGFLIRAEQIGVGMRQTQRLAGNLAYISPEQTGRMDRAIDYRTDFYSLGVVFYELSTGRKPFSSDNPLELAHSHIAEMPKAPHEVNPFIPEMLSRMIMKLLCKSPDQRYQNGTGIIYDLEKCIEKMEVSCFVEPFILGERDVSSKLKFTKKLYGREEERIKLRQIYSKQSGASTRVILIAGQAGVGKTALVNEICRPIAETGGYFAGGKAQQFQRNTPFYVFGQIARDLVGKLLQEPNNRLEIWKQSLQKELNDNGQLIIELAPELAAILGPQIPLVELGLTESRNRFFTTFGNFLKVFADKSHPLTVLLDDLQWCDRPSMELIRSLLLREDITNLMLVCCYRDNEVGAGHPLLGLIEELIKSESTVQLPVKALSEMDIHTMLVEILTNNEEAIHQLAATVYRKTNGNPFFVRKLLTHLCVEDYISFNPSLLRWEWRIQEIEFTTLSDNVVDLLINQLLKLPVDTQETLKLAALIGSTFDLKILSAVANVPGSETLRRLEKGLEGEFILVNNPEYVISLEIPFQENISFRFAHDRLQQACIEQLDAGQIKEYQLRIGRTLKKNTPKTDWAEAAMEIVGHLNEGLCDIDYTEECWETAELNLWASQKAKDASAFYLALNYIECAAHILPDHPWEHNYSLTYAIYKSYVECAYLNNDYQQAEKYAKALLKHAGSDLEKAEILWLQSSLSNIQSQLDKAIHYALQGLIALNYRSTEHPTMPYLLKEMAFVRMQLIGKHQEQLLSLKPLRDTKVQMAIKLWNEINRASYLYGNTNLFLLSILKQMQLTLRYGSYHEIGKTYVSYAMILAVMGDYQGTFDFCELGRLASEQHNSKECLPTIFFSSGFFGHAWNKPWKDMEQWYEKSMSEATKFGDHHTIALAGAFMYAFTPDVNIRYLVGKYMKQLPLVKQTENGLAYNLSFLMIHRWLNYAGLTDAPFSMSVSEETHRQNGGIGLIYTEEECLQAMHEGNFNSALGVYFNEKAFIHYMYDDYEGALKYLYESDKYLSNHVGTPYYAECRLCNFLVLAANITKGSSNQLEKRLKKEMQPYKKWAKHCEDNFAHRLFMMKAEQDRLAGRYNEAIEHYDHAIQLARKNGFMRDEAIANELAGKVLIERGKQKHAVVYLIEAIKIYKLWGADAKVEHMVNKYDHLLRLSGYAEVDSAATLEQESLDAISMERAVSTIIQEAQMPSIMAQILKTVIENSGAQKAVIVLKSEQGWKITAEDRSGADQPEVLLSIPLESGDAHLPISLINYCIRTGESVVLGNASISERFYKDPYIETNHILSLLSMPISNKGIVDGILYLENNLSTDVFTKERIHTLQLLTAQFSVSINSVRLFLELMEKAEEVHKASEEVLRSDIAFLQAQIKPHFLYNAINTISAFSLDDSQMTRDLLARLSEYLRGSFDFKNRDKLVTLRKELDLVEAYLFIEKARFGDRLKVSYHIDEGVDCLLPPLIIQPLVENAVHHGIGNLKKGGTVEIKVTPEKEGLVIIVEDDGVGMDDATLHHLFEDHPEKPGGVALRNIQLRLLQLYGHGLEIERKPAGGTRVTIRITK